jgi:hypothetical protein
MRPEVGTQTHFKKKLPPKKYCYDNSLLPALEWDGQNPAGVQLTLWCVLCANSQAFYWPQSYAAFPRWPA